MSLCCGCRTRLVTTTLPATDLHAGSLPPPAYSFIHPHRSGEPATDVRQVTDAISVPPSRPRCHRRRDGFRNAAHLNPQSRSHAFRALVHYPAREDDSSDHLHDWCFSLPIWRAGTIELMANPPVIGAAEQARRLRHQRDAAGRCAAAANWRGPPNLPKSQHREVRSPLFHHIKLNLCRQSGAARWNRANASAISRKARANR